MCFTWPLEKKANRTTKNMIRRSYQSKGEFSGGKKEKETKTTAS
ncbi:hypothetical protein JOC94_004188 [Bacillus thermophilus]|uniref:Uncharacterized protein n=1 Tax=Siminovitchia thermophila TaxID=1245522 RepID=A0ABS2RE69_9BACI|nr:hypothetical protein [Siminovitchia thermophila]